MDAFNAVVHQGHQVGIGVQQSQELEGLHGVVGGGVDGDHRALRGSGIHIGVGAGHEGDLDAALCGSGVLIAQRVGLGADEVVGAQLSSGTGVVGGFSHGQGRINVASLVVLVHLLHELLVLGSGKLVQQHIAVSAVLGDVFGVQVQGQQVHGAGIASHDDGVGHHALKHHGLHQEGVEGIALDFLGFGEQLTKGVEVHGLKLLQGVAQFVQQGNVHVPAVLGGDVLVAVDGVDALAVCALDGGGLHQGLGDGLEQLSAMLGDQVVQLDEVAVLGEGVVLIGAPGTGEHHVNGVVSHEQSIGGLLVEVAPGAPDDFQLCADLVLDVLVDSFQHRSVVGHVGAVEHDGDGGELVGGCKAEAAQHHCQSQEQSQEFLHDGILLE